MDAGAGPVDAPPTSREQRLQHIETELALLEAQCARASPLSMDALAARVLAMTDVCRALDEMAPMLVVDNLLLSTANETGDALWVTIDGVLDRLAQKTTDASHPAQVDAVAACFFGVARLCEDAGMVLLFDNEGTIEAGNERTIDDETTTRQRTHVHEMVENKASRRDSPRVHQVERRAPVVVPDDTMMEETTDNLVEVESSSSDDENDWFAGILPAAKSPKGGLRSVFVDLYLSNG
ncbi:Aste57867_11584 [Aphanomyces stellatus]|uniref:Aste57867_11584 protein n=1 Tax=Aphanomyces stellatus TaxID=120398 RepID=A0A485KTY3_9STRA|nr:hypothetical protein As57867_011541 [Aphanomyces stellatus]VFT88443.1 Aste57867_11584 [Aphanomyces stellatus]